MKLIITGSILFNDYLRLKEETDLFLKEIKENGLMKQDEELIIVSGGTAGAEKLGERYAIDNGYSFESYLPEWYKGNVSVILNNLEMVRVSNACLIFNTVEDRGVGHMAKYANEKGLYLKEVDCNS